jgi:hypothetical protein
MNKAQENILALEQSLIESYRRTAAINPPAGRYVVVLIAELEPETQLFYGYRNLSSHEQALAAVVLEPTRPVGSVLYCCVVGMCTDDQRESLDQIHGMVCVLTPDSCKQVA